MSRFAPSIHHESQPLPNAGTSVGDTTLTVPTIAEIFLARGWAQQIEGQLRLNDPSVFWGAIADIIRELATIGCFPTQAWFRQVVAQGKVEGNPSAWFEVRAYRIRQPGLADLPALLRLEDACWSEPLRATEVELRQRIERNPQGHYLLEMAGQVAGVIYSQRIGDPQALFQTNFRAVAALHRPDASIAQPLAVNVLPELQQYGLGDQLLEFLLQLFTLQPDIERVAAVTLCKHYVQHNNLPMEEYIHRRNAQGQLIDPILNFHGSHGAQICCVVDGYRPADLENQGKGVLVEYDLRNRLFKRTATSQSEQTLPIATVVEEAVRAVMGEARVMAFSRQRPLKGTGL